MATKQKSSNPRRKPRTEADVNRAFERGVCEGVANASAIFLTVLLDHYGMAEQIQELWKDIIKLSEEVGEHRVRLSELRRVLLDEYKIRV